MADMITVQRSMFIAALLPLAACHTLQLEPRVPLRLLSAAPLQLAEGCTASGSISVDFVIEPSGATRDIAIPAAPQCLQRALRDWVGSFQYAPLPAALPSSVEWLLVTAPKL